ncbi:MAG: D-alanyl-D-alanine carboxypeptidase [Clostridia bacterium]|nr:D-alanyl-D-alanine carboxypeptidase [Clostridia bacterium]
MKKIVLISLIFMILSKGTLAFDETLIEDEEGLYVETIANVDVPNLNARAAILYDVTYDRILYEKNAKQRRANASTTKMITALVAYEYGDLDDMVEVSRNAATTGGSSINLKTGDKISLDSLIKGLLVHSGNDAAVAIAEYIAGDVESFSKLMNQKAQEIGAVDTHFVSPHGLDEDNHYSTAYDLMLISKEMLKNTYLANIISQKTLEITVNDNSKALNSTNEMLSYYEGANGVKTGYTGNAGRCLISSAKKNERQLISVVLGCDSKKNRTVDSIRLLDYGFNNYEIVNLADFVKKDLYIVVDKSEGEIYRLSKDLNLMYPLKENEKEKVEVEYDLKTNLTAPLFKGENVGTVKIKLDGGIINQIEYTLPQNINRKSWQNYFNKVFTDSLKNIINFKLKPI